MMYDKDSLYIPRSGIRGERRLTCSVGTTSGRRRRQQVPKHNFTVCDLTRVLLALWTYDYFIFIH